MCFSKTTFTVCLQPSFVLSRAHPSRIIDYLSCNQAHFCVAVFSMLKAEGSDAARDRREKPVRWGCADGA